MSATPRLALTEITASQAQKEVTLNTDLWQLDAYVQPVIQDRHLTAPPVGPASGACYIVASVASGAWAGKEKYVAQYRNAAWVFFAPFEGLTVYLADENVYLLYDGAAWVLMGVGLTGGDHGALTGLADDDHTQYPLLAGRAGGQAIVGGPGATDDLNLSSTRHVVLQGAGGNVGIGVLLPSYALSLAGNAARTIGAERNADAGGAGTNLTIRVGGATSGETDKAGGTLLLKSGIATGTGSSDIQFYVAVAGATGVTDRVPSLALTIFGTKEMRLDSNAGFNNMRPTAVSASGQGVGSFGFKTSDNVQQASFLAVTEGTSDATPLVGIALRTGGSTANKFWIAANGNIGCNVAVGGFGTSAVKVLGIGAGTAPSTSPADMVQVWAADQAAGNCCLFWRTENGGVGQLYQLAHVADPAGGATVDAEARTAINAILVTLESLGFHAP